MQTPWSCLHGSFRVCMAIILLCGASVVLCVHCDCCCGIYAQQLWSWGFSLQSLCWHPSIYLVPPCKTCSPLSPSPPPLACGYLSIWCCWTPQRLRRCFLSRTHCYLLAVLCSFYQYHLLGRSATCATSLAPAACRAAADIVRSMGGCRWSAMRTLIDYSSSEIIFDGKRVTTYASQYVKYHRQSDILKKRYNPAKKI